MSGRPRGVKLTYSQFSGKRIEIWQAIAEKALGKSLPLGAEIHHVDGNRANNAPGNLVICPSAAYHNLLHLRTDALNNGAPPHYRKCTYCKLYDDPSNMLIIQIDPRRPSGVAIHRECRVQYLRNHRLKQKISTA